MALAIQGDVRYHVRDVVQEHREAVGIFPRDSAAERVIREGGDPVVHAGRRETIKGIAENARVRKEAMLLRASKCLESELSLSEKKSVAERRSAVS